MVRRITIGTYNKVRYIKISRRNKAIEVVSYSWPWLSHYESFFFVVLLHFDYICKMLQNYKSPKDSTNAFFLFTKHWFRNVQKQKKSCRRVTDYRQLPKRKAQNLLFLFTPSYRKGNLLGRRILALRYESLAFALHADRFKTAAPYAFLPNRMAHGQNYLPVLIEFS